MGSMDGPYRLWAIADGFGISDERKAIEMGLASRLIRPKAASWGPTDDKWYTPGGAFYGGITPTQAGVSVDSDSAMRLMTVQNCVRVRAFTISQLPCHIMEKKGEQKNKATDFYLYEKLHDQPNSWMTSAEFWAMAEAYICLRGNFYVYKMGIEGRPIKELIPLKSDTVTEVEQNEDFSLTYHVKMRDGTIEPIPGSRLMHLRGLTLDGITGVNPIEYARETIGLGIASNQFLGRYFSKGLHPGAVIKHPMPLSGTAFANRRKALKERYEGLGKAWEFMLLDENMDISFPQIKLIDAQYLEQMKMNEAQICGLFRVPLMLIQSGDKTPTYASAEQFMLSYSIYGVTPDCVNYEKAIRRDLLTPQERKKYYAKFEIRALLRSSFKEQMDSFATGIDKEILNPNECRALLDYNPYKGGDEYRTRTSSMKESSKESEKAVKS